MERERRLRGRRQFAALAARLVGIEDEAALVEALQEHHADIGETIGIDGRYRDPALASVASFRLASSNQVANRRNGSSAAVKSPLVNQLGCSIGAVVFMIEGWLGCSAGWVMYRSRRPPYRGRSPASLWRRLRPDRGAGARHAGGRLQRSPISWGRCSAKTRSSRSTPARWRRKCWPSRRPNRRTPRCRRSISPMRALPPSIWRPATARRARRGKTRKTGARGSVTPIAQAYASDGTTCRDFLASYVNEGAEAWMQGAGLSRHPRQVGGAQPAAVETHLRGPRARCQGGSDAPHWKRLGPARRSG